MFNAYKAPHIDDGVPRITCPQCLHPHAYRREGYHFTTNQRTEEIACPVCRKTYVKMIGKEKGSSLPLSLC